jgi:hypothetical protein
MKRNHKLRYISLALALLVVGLLAVVLAYVGFVGADSSVVLTPDSTVKSLMVFGTTMIVSALIIFALLSRMQ